MSDEREGYLIRYSRGFAPFIVARASAQGIAVGDECLRRGLSMNIVRSTGGMLNCFRMAPPLSIPESEIGTAITIIDEAITAVLASCSR